MSEIALSEIAFKFLLANLAIGLAVAGVALARKPVRAMFGPALAYGLWVLVPLSALASLAPSRVVEIVQPAPAMAAPISSAPVVLAPIAAPDPALSAAGPQPAGILAPPPVAPSIPLPGPWTVAALIWLAGAIATLGWQLRNQSRFMADARAGFAGPAVAGVLRPRIVLPADFDDRFDPSERDVVLAHERLHLDRNDARINAIVALARCICWFNPLVHVAAHLMRIDQELACDAAVVARHPRARAAYASALLKAELAARPLPLGCYWPARARHPLMERIEMLTLPTPGRLRRHAGVTVIALLAAAAGGGTWAAIPSRAQLVETPTAAVSPSRAPAISEGASAAAAPAPSEPEIFFQPSGPMASPELIRFEAEPMPAPQISHAALLLADTLHVSGDLATAPEPAAETPAEQARQPNPAAGPAISLPSLNAAASAPGIAAPANRCPSEPNPKAINPDVIECHAAFAPVPVVPALLRHATPEERIAYGDWLIRQLDSPEVCGKGARIAGQDSCASLIFVLPRAYRKVGVPLATAMPWVYVVRIYRITHPANPRDTLIDTSDGIYGPNPRPVWQLLAERRAAQRCKDTIGGGSCARMAQQDLRYVPMLLLPRKEAARVLNATLIRDAFESPPYRPLDIDPKPYINWGVHCPMNADCN